MAMLLSSVGFISLSNRLAIKKERMAFFNFIEQGKFSIKGSSSTRNGKKLKAGLPGFVWIAFLCS
jgi:hypothetical protein